MNRSIVAVVRAHNYDKAEIRSAVAAALAKLGGVAALVKPKAKVFVKINHLSPPSLPERGIITHPEVTAAVLTLLQDVTPHITVGDDLHPSTPDGFEVSGYRAMCQYLGVRLINLREEGFRRVNAPGEILKGIYLAHSLLEADVIVNLPKLKTHSLTLFTGAVKNMYGVIPGGLRVIYHGQHKDPSEFSRLLVDVFAAARPHLTIMDGVLAMEGAGPANGRLRELGVIIASQDAVALDAVASRIIGIEPSAVGTTRYACERGLGISSLDGIEVVGTPVGSVAVSDFRLPPIPAGEIVGHAPRFLTQWITRQLAVRPHVVLKRCVGCAACARICPTGAATVTGGKARIDRRTCIRCMCCHEVCRFDAVSLRRSFLGRLLHPTIRAGRRTRPHRHTSST